MTLYDVLNFSIHYQPTLPELLFLWLRQYKLTHQVAFTHFLYNGAQLGKKYINNIPTATYDHKLCKCNAIYDALNLEIYPINTIGKCVENLDLIVKKKNINGPLNNKILAPLYRYEHNTKINKHEFQTKKIENSFSQSQYDNDPADTSIYYNGFLTISGLLRLFNNLSIDIYMILKNLTCLEAYAVHLLTHPMQHGFFIKSLQLLVPEYLRPTRHHSREVMYNVDILTIENIYKFVNRNNVFLSIPPTTFGFREFKMKSITFSELQKLEHDKFTCQLNYAGNKCYINVNNGKLYIFDDFGRKITLHNSIRFIFKQTDTFLIECVRITQGQMYRSGYIDGKHIFIITDVLIWNGQNLIFTPFVSRCKKIIDVYHHINSEYFLPSAIYSLDNYTEIRELYYNELSAAPHMSLHFNGIVLKNATNNLQLKYKFNPNKYVIFHNDDSRVILCNNQSSSDNIRVNGIILPDIAANMCAYFFAQRKPEKKSILLFVFNSFFFEPYMLIEINTKKEFQHTYKLKNKDRKYETYAIVKVGFEKIDVNCMIYNIKYIQEAPTRNIYNTITFHTLEANRCYYSK
jgi:hypothetical protein